MLYLVSCIFSVHVIRTNRDVGLYVGYVKIKLIRKYEISSRTKRKFNVTLV